MKKTDPLFFVRVPTELKPFKNCAGIGLHYVSRGYRPESPPPQTTALNTCCVRLRLSAQAVSAMEAARPEFPSMTELFTTALAWVAEQPEHIQAVKF